MEVSELGSGRVSFPRSSSSWSLFSVCRLGYSKSTLMKSLGDVVRQSITASGKSVAGLAMGLHTLMSWYLPFKSSSASAGGKCRRTRASAAPGV